VKTIIAAPLRDAHIVTKPAFHSNDLAGDYISALRELCPSLRSTAKTSIRIFERWLASSRQKSPMKEDVLRSFRQDMKTGSFRRENRRPYGIMARHAPTHIYSLHNLAAAQGAPGFLRQLKRAQVTDKYLRFLSLTQITQTALIWFELEAPKARKRNGRGDTRMTGRMRQLGVGQAMSFLQGLGVDGLELVSAESLPKLDPDGKDYQRLTRKRHNVAIVYRACCAEGLLSCNPLENASHESFGHTAERPFLAPDMVIRIRDLSTVNRKDWEQLANRLTVLLLLDLAVRRSELAGLRRSDIRRDRGVFRVRLRSEVQKMSNKPTVYLEILYPETAELLDLWMKRRVLKEDALIPNRSGYPASGSVIDDRLKREAERLGLACYQSGKLPTRHALRRTFATCNSAPIGMAMPPDEIANRLRIDLQVAYTHYVLRNPLISSLKAQTFRDRLEHNPREMIQRRIKELRQGGTPEEFLNPIAQWLDQTHPASNPEPQAEVQQTWVSLDEGMRRLQATWGELPGIRALKAHFREHGGLRSPGQNLAPELDKEMVEDLAAHQVLEALLGPIELSRRDQNRIQSEITMVKIGRTRLVPADQIPALLKLRNHFLANASTTGKLSTEGIGHSNRTTSSIVHTQLFKIPKKEPPMKTRMEHSMDQEIENLAEEALINASSDFLDHRDLQPILDRMAAPMYEIEDLGEMEIDNENGTYLVAACFTVIPVMNDEEDNAENYADAVLVSVTARIEPDGNLTDFSFEEAGM